MELFPVVVAAAFYRKERMFSDSTLFHCGQLDSGACDLINVHSRASPDAPHKTLLLLIISGLQLLIVKGKATHYVTQF